MYLCTIDNGAEFVEGTGSCLKDAYSSASSQLTTAATEQIRFYRCTEIEWVLDDKPNFLDLSE